MNRWLRVLGFLFISIIQGEIALAACQAEVNRAKALINVDPSSKPAHAKSMQDHLDHFMREPPNIDISEARRNIKNQEGTIKEYSRKSDINNPSSIATVAHAQFVICLYEWLIDRNSNSKPQANEVLSAQQRQQQNQSQDELVTGPKEDCNALLRNVKTPEDANAHIACLRRNLSRSNNAEKAQSAQPSAATQQNQSAQQESNQSQQTANQNQARADQARQGKRKTHDPAAEAHQCIEIDKEPGLFGAFKNICNYKVNFSTCNYKPRVKSGGFNWSADFDCEQQKFGLHTPDGGRAVASHNRNTEMVYWFACKAPAFPVDTEFVAGSGVRGRCN